MKPWDLPSSWGVRLSPPPSEPSAGPDLPGRIRRARTSPGGEDAGRDCDPRTALPRSTTAQAYGLTDVLRSKGSTFLRRTSRSM
jgi:hypothetical protein